LKFVCICVSLFFLCFFLCFFVIASQAVFKHGIWKIGSQCSALFLYFVMFSPEFHTRSDQICLRVDLSPLENLQYWQRTDAHGQYVVATAEWLAAGPDDDDDDDGAAPADNKIIATQLRPGFPSSVSIQYTRA